MNRFLMSLLALFVLSGCGSSSDLKVSSVDLSDESNSVKSDDYTFTLTVNDNSESNSLLTAELRYEGAEEQVKLQHSTEIVSYEVFDQNNEVIHAEFPTDASNQTTLSTGDNTFTKLHVSLSDLPSAGEYTVIAVAKFTDASSNKKYKMENTISFKIK